MFRDSITRGLPEVYELVVGGFLVEHPFLPRFDVVQLSLEGLHISVEVILVLQQVQSVANVQQCSLDGLPTLFEILDALLMTFGLLFNINKYVQIANTSHLLNSHHTQPNNNPPLVSTQEYVGTTSHTNLEGPPRRLISAVFPRR